MEPSIPWPSGPEGYTHREQKFVKAYKEQSDRADRNGRWCLSLTAGLIISLTLLGTSLAFGQHQKTLIIDHSDLTHPRVLEVYKDQSDSGHYYIFETDGTLTEIWVNPFPALSTPKSQEPQSVKLLFNEDPPLEEGDWWKILPPQEGNWWESPDTGGSDFQFEYLYKND